MRGYPKEGPMVATEDQLAEIQRLETMWEVSPSPSPAARRRTPRVEPRTWMSMIRIVWVASLLAMFVFEPTPSDPDVVPSAWVTAAAVGLLMALGAMFWGMARRSTWAFGASAIAGGLGMALAYECRASGHHLGAWWIVELGVFAAITASSLGALRSGRGRADHL